MPPHGDGKPGRAEQYEIRFLGRLGPRWAEWFDDMALSAEGDGVSVLRGPLVDQSALHGVLSRLRDLGLPLLSVTPIDHDGPVQAPLHPTP
jgi:hypothetical protein